MRRRWPGPGHGRRTPHVTRTRLTALINFLIIAATLFIIIKAFEEMQKRRKVAGEDVAEDKSDEVVLLGEIRDLLRDRA